MIWHTEAEVIVNLTNLTDIGSQAQHFACYLYWPLRPTEVYRFGHIL